MFNPPAHPAASSLASSSLNAFLRVRNLAEQIDERDRQIIDELRRDGRMSIRALAEKLHISRANAYTRVRRLLDSGVLRGFRAEVDPELLGLGTSAYITLNIDQVQWRNVRESLRKLPGVSHIALVGGEFDVIMHVRAKDNADLRRIVLEQIQGMPGVINTRTLLVFDEPALEPDPIAGEPA